MGIGRENTSSTHHSFRSLRWRWSSCPLRLVKWYKDGVPMGMQGGMGQTICPSALIRRCGKFAAGLCHLRFFLAPRKRKLGFASHIHPQHIHTQLPWLWTREQAHTTVLLTKSSCMSRDCQFETRPQLCYQLFLLHTEYRESTACRVIL